MAGTKEELLRYGNNDGGNNSILSFTFFMTEASALSIYFPATCKASLMMSSESYENYERIVIIRPLHRPLRSMFLIKCHTPVFRGDWFATASS